MINFVIDFWDENVIIQLEKKSYIFDNAKNAGEAVYYLLQGVNTIESLGGQEYLFSIIVRYDQEDVENIMMNFSEYKRENEFDSLFAEVFFEEVHLAWYVRGGCDE
tara:strand:+ start:495 stop:812 length:318 start_codon:yes stop_codon:yes gene_type:complete